MQWWRQTAADAQPRATLKVILKSARERWQQESCRRGDSEKRQEMGSKG